MLRQTLRIISNHARTVKINRINITIRQSKQSLVFNGLNFQTKYEFAALPKHSLMNMPALSPTMDKGNIVKWVKQVGDKVETGDVICEVETDKATVGFEVQEDGYLAKILHPEGTKDIKVGDLVAILVAKKADLNAFENYNQKESSAQKDQSSSAQKDQSSDKKPADNKTTEKQFTQEKSDKKQSTQEKSDKPSEKQAGTTKQYPKHSKLGLPALSPTMERGNIMKWLKKEGDKLEPGDVICEVETDKATVGFEVQEDSYLAKILIQEGAKDIALGETLAITTPKKEFVKEFLDYGENKSQSTQQDDKSANQDNKASSQDSKASSQHSKVSSQDKKASSQDNKASSQDNKASNKDQQQPSHQEPKQEQKQEEKTEQSTNSSNDNQGGRIYASPLAKQFANQNNVELSGIQGTGMSGSITKMDVENHIKNASSQQQQQQQQPKQQQQAEEEKQTQNTQTTAPAKQQSAQSTQGTEPNPYSDIEVSSIRKIIANRLLESKTTIPHYYLTMKINMDALLQLREELNKISKVKISVNDFIVKASALALRDIPEVNSQWHGAIIRKFNNADISIAVSTDNGLITPIVFNAGAKGLSTIATTTKSLAEKARTNKLKPQEFQGGTFTISNLGMFGIDQFIAVINPPQAAILAVGKTSKNLVPDEMDINKHKVLSQMDVTLSCDHRVVDGAVGAQWLQKFKAYMESPSTMLL